MADHRLRELERRYHHDNDMEAYAALAAHRCRVGECCGHAEDDTISVPRPTDNALKCGVNFQQGFVGPYSAPITADDNYDPHSVRLTIHLSGDRPEVMDALKWMQHVFAHDRHRRYGAIELGDCLGYQLPPTPDEISSKDRHKHALAETLGITNGQLGDIVSLIHGEPGDPANDALWQANMPPEPIGDVMTPEQFRERIQSAHDEIEAASVETEEEEEDGE